MDFSLDLYMSLILALVIIETQFVYFVGEGIVDIDMVVIKDKLQRIVVACEKFMTLQQTSVAKIFISLTNFTLLLAFKYHR